jgi:hypothetical protein
VLEDVDVLGEEMQLVEDLGGLQVGETLAERLLGPLGDGLYVCDTLLRVQIVQACCPIQERFEAAEERRSWTIIERVGLVGVDSAYQPCHVNTSPLGHLRAQEVAYHCTCRRPAGCRGVYPSAPLARSGKSTVPRMSSPACNARRPLYWSCSCNSRWRRSSKNFAPPRSESRR